MGRLKYLLSGFSFLVMASGCVQSPVYQKNVVIPGAQWRYDFKPAFTFDITDTTVLYNVFFVVRHTNAYPYSNIWMWLYVKGPTDSTFTKTRIEVPLADPSGRWFGRGMGEIWEQRMPISHEGDTAILRGKGRYEFRLEQNMREEKLPEVLNVGLRIEMGNKRGMPVATYVAQPAQQ